MGAGGQVLHRGPAGFVAGFLVPLVVVGAFGGACGDEKENKPPDPDLAIAVFTSWTVAQGSPARVGYVFSVEVVEQGGPFGCTRSWATSTTVRANDEPLPIDLPAGCLHASGIVGPFLEPQSLSVRLTEDGRTIAEAELDGLMPGTEAILASPADGRVRAGDDIVVVPPAALPLSEPLEGQIFLQGEPVANAPSVTPVRRLDGIHVTAPAFTGPAILAIWNPLGLSEGTGTCTGFKSCTAGRAEAAGPIRLEGVP